MPVGERGPDRTYRPDMRVPTIHGLHQPGIATPQFEHGLVAAYDVDDLRATLEAWTATAETMMRGGGLTVTIGLGPGVFDPATRPVALSELPAFAGDALDPARCGGDVCVFVNSTARVEPPFPGSAVGAARHAPARGAGSGSATAPPCLAGRSTSTGTCGSPAATAAG